jgi:hypothetical protein
MGEVTINNAIFLVFEDKDFYVAPARFQINAIVGFPIIEALKEISFRKNGEVFLPANPGAGGEQNMFLDGLTPGIAGVFRGRRLTFTFDSGADNTLFYPRFYRANETEIKRKYKAQPRRLGGAGGVTPVIAYRVTDLVISFSGKDARFTAADILTRGVNEEARYYDGNLGQDLIKQFEKMTINFNFVAKNSTNESQLLRLLASHGIRGWHSKIPRRCDRRKHDRSGDHKKARHRVV